MVENKQPPETPQPPPKRPRGRPRKHPLPGTPGAPPKRPRGRPRKHPAKKRKKAAPKKQAPKRKKAAPKRKKAAPKRRRRRKPPARTKDQLRKQAEQIHRLWERDLATALPARKSALYTIDKYVVFYGPDLSAFFTIGNIARRLSINRLFRDGLIDHVPKRAMQGAWIRCSLVLPPDIEPDEDDDSEEAEEIRKKLDKYRRYGGDMLMTLWWVPFRRRDTREMLVEARKLAERFREKWSARAERVVLQFNRAPDGSNPRDRELRRK